MSGADSTQIHIAEAIAAAKALATGSAGWDAAWSGAQGAITGAESAFGNDQLGSQLRSGYQPSADQIKPQAGQLGESWKTLSDGANQPRSACSSRIRTTRTRCVPERC